MINITFCRRTKVRTTLPHALDLLFDTHHFMSLHRKQVKLFKIIKEENGTTIFYYEAYFSLLFVRFTSRFIVVRLSKPELQRYEQILLDLKTKKQTYLRVSVNEIDDSTIEYVNEYLIEVSKIGYFFRNILISLINFRAHQMWIDDHDLLVEMAKLGKVSGEDELPPMDKLIDRIPKMSKKFDNYKLDRCVQIDSLK